MNSEQERTWQIYMQQRINNEQKIKNKTEKEGEKKKEPTKIDEKNVQDKLPTEKLQYQEKR